MSSATGPLIKPLSMANGCLTSLPSIFTTKTSFSFISLPSKPIKFLRFSCSSSSYSPAFPSWASLKNKNSFSSPVVSMVASTSDWAQKEESEVEEDESKWENDEGEEEGSSGEDVEASSEESYSEPPEEAKLFVANLPYDVDSQQLAELFQQAGIVEIAEVIYNRQTDQSRGFGFVTMSTIEEAEKAIEMFNRYGLNGRLLTVNKAGEKGSRPDQPRQDFEPALRVYVGNLPWQVDSDRLEQVFSEFGKVIDARVLTDQESGRSRGFGFVTMSTQAEVQDAIAALDGQELDGRAIKVNVSEQRQRRSSY